MAASGLPATKIGFAWQTTGAQIPPSRLLRVTATTANIPVDGELTHLDASGYHEYLITTAGSASAAARTVAGICSGANNENGYLYNPGVIGGTYTQRKRVQFGGRGSHTNATGAIDQRFIILIDPGMSWVMSRYTDDAVVVGASYGYRRVTAGNVFIDISIADDTLEVVGFYEPDRDGLNGAAFQAIPRVWVKPFLLANI